MTGPAKASVGEGLYDRAKAAYRTLSRGYRRLGRGRHDQPELGGSLGRALTVGLALVLLAPVLWIATLVIAFVCEAMRKMASVGIAVPAATSRMRSPARSCVTRSTRSSHSGVAYSG